MMKKLFFAIAILFAGCTSQSDHFAKVERECNFSPAEQKRAWNNIVVHVRSEYPVHSTFCELDESAEQQSFLVVEGECRVYLGCSKNIDGEFLMHGDMLVVLDEETQEVKKAYGVKW